MPRGSTPKEERQYEHIKETYEKRGQKGRAEEIAARTVNKERAERGETKSSSKPAAKSGAKSSGSRSSSTSSKSGKPSARSGSSSSRKPAARSSGGDKSRTQLYEEAKRKNISGRSSMNKEQLERALSR
jgi:activator of HSP90 ATPase